MKKIIFMLLLMPLFVACSDDDDKEIKIQHEITEIDGDWLRYSTGETTATEATFSTQGYTFSGIIYSIQGSTCTKTDSQEGFYAFNKETQYLRFSILQEQSGKMSNPIYELKSVSDCNMTLLNVEFNSIEEYSKIVSKNQVGTGTVIDNGYVAKAGLSGAEFVSLNPSTASVDSEGNITAKAAGVTFILAKSGDKQVAVKMDIKPKVQIYASYIGLSIDKILSTYGTPDAQGSTSETTDGALYNTPANDSNLSKIQFQYDATTRAIVRILTIFNDENSYNAEADYVKNNYIWNDNFGVYFETEYWWQSELNILPFEQNGVYYIHYGNTKYLIDNGHY